MPIEIWKGHDMRLPSLLISLTCLAGLLAPAQAQEARASVRLDLNTVSQLDGACRMTFTGRADPGVEALVVETVLFDTSGGVSLMTLFDFGSLPAQKTRVRQFDLPNTQCGSVGQVLFNGIDSCTGAGCAAGALSVGSRIAQIEVLG
jgi:hypothetical protein